MRWLIAKLTPMLNSVRRTTGSTQLGFLTMSSNVAFGEKNTPMIRPMGLIAGCDCASGAGMDVVAIRGSSTTRAPYRCTATASTSHWAGLPEKFHRLPGIEQAHGNDFRVERQPSIGEQKWARVSAVKMLPMLSAFRRGSQISAPCALQKNPPP